MLSLLVQLNLYKKVEQIFCVAHLNELRFPFLKGKIKFDGAHSYEIPLDGSQPRQPNNQVLLTKKSGINQKKIRYYSAKNPVLFSKKLISIPDNVISQMLPALLLFKDA